MGIGPGTYRSISASASASSIASPAGNDLNGSLLVAFIAGETGPRTISSITDTAGNTWLAVPNAYRSIAGALNPEWGDLWYCRNAIGNAANVVTANLSGAATFRSIHIHSYPNADLLAPVAGEASNTLTIAGTSITSRSYTPPVGGVGVVGINPEQGQASWTPGDGYTTRTTETTASRTTADYIGVPPGAKTMTMTYPTSSQTVLCLAFFAPAPGTAYIVRGVIRRQVP